MLCHRANSGIERTLRCAEFSYIMSAFAMLPLGEFTVTAAAPSFWVIPFRVSES